MNLTKQTVDKFLSLRKKAATTIATGVMLCILSPVLLLTLLSLSKLNILNLPNNAAAATGIIFLLIIVAISVGLFISADFKLDPFEKMEYEDFDLSDELISTVQKEKDQYAKTYATMTTAAIVIFILSAIPVIAGTFFENTPSFENLMVGLVAITLIFVSIGVFLLVKCNTIMNSYNILLQTGDYTSKNKKGRKLMNKYAAIYWLIATLLYLGYSFITNNWERSWIVWPISGILYGILEKVFSLKNDKMASE
ncbi:hypothetical protein [uncultured Lactobacillus sp.]|uniref:hypothetical protein n=1 Tax=uncultured Lactobacillus sp. TaxID=153152 RepID=UPI0028051413|nr:hypothetical protein [uncultured Lactobacillus sp.]